MLSNWSIRVKFLIGLALLLLLVAVLTSSGLVATSAYRSLVKGLRQRAEELPFAANLSRKVGDLRFTVGQISSLKSWEFPGVGGATSTLMRNAYDQFGLHLVEVKRALSEYRRQLERKGLTGSRIADTQREWRTVHEIEAALTRVDQLDCYEQWLLGNAKVGQLKGEIEELQKLAGELPGHLHQQLNGFAVEARSRYHALFAAMGIASAAAALILILLLRLFYRWVVRPLGILIDGSRRVAGGQFQHRIRLDTHDEMAELARAMNAMTTRFEAIRDDLDRQVRERTQQVVRGEQLASVGFLAAGVAHEINNPLASIAMSAESLESRICEILDCQDDRHAVIARYLEMIQSEAFRCKEITEKLLDFSRTGRSKRERIELGALVAGVVEMVSHLGKYQKKRIELRASAPVFAPVNPQEMKQIVLNLLTNALDSLREGGTVRISLAERHGWAEVCFADDGRGMEPAVLRRVFEPFFTRRPGGQGTGLGLSITHRIVTDHGGRIEAASPGPGRGSTFRVRLPLVEEHKESENRQTAPQSTQAPVC
ncbi:MAG: sensor histidine kinase [Planctomycetota bacterium]